MKKIIRIIRRNIFTNIIFEYIFRCLIRKFPTSPITKLVPNHFDYNKNTFRKFKNRGIYYEGDISDFMVHYLYFGFQDDGLNKMLSYIKEGDIIIDVGTNIGCSVMNFALKTGSDGKIYGFEPDIINYNQCKKHINLNKFENISLYNIGIGNNNGKYNLIIDDPNNRGTNKISINDKSKIKKESIEVLITTIDEWVLKNKIEKINVIKIDVEGFDLKVIEGAEETIKKYNPILFVELDNNNLLKVNDSAVKLIHKLNQLNYECREIISNQLIDTSYTNFENCHFDIICIKTK